MIYVRVELWPHGDKSRAVVHSEIRIANDGTGTTTRGNYTYGITGKSGTLMNRGRVTSFARNAKHAVDLLKLVLNDARK